MSKHKKKKNNKNKSKGRLIGKHPERSEPTPTTEEEGSQGCLRSIMQTFAVIFLALRSLFGRLAASVLQRSTPMSPALLPTPDNKDSSVKHSRPSSPYHDAQQPPLKQPRIDDEQTPEKTFKKKEPVLLPKAAKLITIQPFEKEETPKEFAFKSSESPEKSLLEGEKEQPLEKTIFRTELFDKDSAQDINPPLIEITPDKEETPKETPIHPPKAPSPEPEQLPKEPPLEKPTPPPQPKKTKPTIEEKLNSFGYKFIDGELRDIKTNGKFEFNVYEKHTDNQKRYEELGKVINQYVYYLLEKDTKLKRMSIPLDASANEGRGFIFHSEDAFDCDRLMLIIHGSGVVRAGQWARRLIINHSLESGTQLPYIKKAKELGYGVLVLNSNQNYDEESHRKIRGSGSPEGHFDYVWSEIVRKRCKAEHVAIVAHSYGGQITVRGASNNADVLDKTFAVAFTDSVHYQSSSSEKFGSWMENHVCNWVSSGSELDTRLRSSHGDCLRVSAGTSVHEETSWKSFNSVWKFIDEQWQLRMKKLKLLKNRDDENDKVAEENTDHHKEL